MFEPIIHTTLENKVGSWCQKYNNEASYFFAATEYKREDLYVHTQKNLINQVKSWEEKRRKLLWSWPEKKWFSQKKKFSEQQSSKSSCAKNGEAKTGINPICLHSNSEKILAYFWRNKMMKILSNVGVQSLASKKLTSCFMMNIFISPNRALYHQFVRRREFLRSIFSEILAVKSSLKED